MPPALIRSLQGSAAAAWNALVRSEAASSRAPVEPPAWWIPESVLPPDTAPETLAGWQLTIPEWRFIGFVPLTLPDRAIECAVRAELDLYVADLPEGRLSLPQLARGLAWCGCLEPSR